MARKKSPTQSHRGVNHQPEAPAKKETVIPKSYLEEKAEDGLGQVDRLFESTKRQIENQKTEKLLQDLIDTTKDNVHEIISEVDVDGIKFREDQQEFCNRIDRAVQESRNAISRSIQQRRGDDSGPKQSIKRALNQILKGMVTEASQRFELPTKVSKVDKIKTKEELLHHIREKILTIFVQNGVNTMLNAINKKNTEANDYFYEDIKTLLNPFLHVLMEGFAEAMINMDADKTISPKRWKSARVIEIIEDALRVREYDERLKLPSHLEGCLEAKNLHTQLQTSFNKIIRSLGGLRGKNKFNKIERQESDQGAVNVLLNMNPAKGRALYVVVRDLNIERHGKYKSSIHFENLSREEQGKITPWLQECFNKKTGLLEVPDQETLEVICEEINELPHLLINFVLPEDVIRIINDYNASQVKESKETLADQTEQLKILFKNKLYKFIQSLTLRISRALKVSISDSKGILHGEFIAVTLQEYEAIFRLFESFKLDLVQMADDMIEQHFEKKDGEWNSKDMPAFFAKLKQPLVDRLAKFEEALQQMGINPNMGHIEDQLGPVNVDFNEIVSDINSGIDPEKAKPEPDIKDLVLRALLYEQGPKDKQNREWLEGREIDDVEKELIGQGLDSYIDTEKLKSTEVTDYLNDWEQTGILDEAAIHFNNRWYCGEKIRTGKDLKDIAFDLLTDKKREIKQLTKVEVELPQELKERLEAALKWVEGLGWPFKEKPEEVGVKFGSPVQNVQGPNANISSYYKIPWAHYIHLIHRDNMPAHVIEHHVRMIETYQDSKKPPTKSQPEGQFSVQHYQSRKKDRSGNEVNRTSISFWLDSTEQPFRAEDQRASVHLDRLDDHIGALQRKRTDLEKELGRLEELENRIAKLHGDIEDLEKQIAECESQILSIDTVVEDIKGQITAIMAGENPNLTEVGKKAGEAEKELKKKGPIEKQKGVIVGLIENKQKDIGYRVKMIANMPKLKAEIAEIDEKLRKVNEHIEEAYSLLT
ncbi:hypothetical protein ACFL3T_00740 [Patescibacteria group bacterium]